MKFFIVFSLVVASTTALSLHKEKQPLPQHNGRIAGGENADIQQFSYQVGVEGILKEDKYTYSYAWCGGSLIAHNWILTAAHCTEGVNKINIYLGSAKRAQSKVRFQIIRTDDNIIEHEDYDSTNVYNDIALIRIPTVKYTRNIQPVHLAKPGQDDASLVGKEAIASGWGDMGDNASGDTPILQWVSMRILSNAECAQTFADIVEGNICMATADDDDDDGIMHSICHGDSGGPLVLSGTNLQIGVSSFVHTKGCEVGAPAAFTRVSFYIDWIEANTGIKF